VEAALNKRYKTIEYGWATKLNWLWPTMTA